MSILDEILRIEQAKQAIKQVLINKGIEITNETLDSFANLIELNLVMKGSSDSGDSGDNNQPQNPEDQPDTPIDSYSAGALRVQGFPDSENPHMGMVWSDLNGIYEIQNPEATSPKEYIYKHVDKNYYILNDFCNGEGYGCWIFNTSTSRTYHMGVMLCTHDTQADPQSQQYPTTDQFTKDNGRNYWYAGITGETFYDVIITFASVSSGSNDSSNKSYDPANPPLVIQVSNAGYTYYNGKYLISAQSVTYNGINYPIYYLENSEMSLRHAVNADRWMLVDPMDAMICYYSTSSNLFDVWIVPQDVAQLMGDPVQPAPTLS